MWTGAARCGPRVPDLCVELKNVNAVRGIVCLNWDEVAKHGRQVCFGNVGRCLWNLFVLCCIWCVVCGSKAMHLFMISSAVLRC